MFREGWDWYDVGLLFLLLVLDSLLTPWISQLIGRVI